MVLYVVVSTPAVEAERPGFDSQNEVNTVFFLHQTKVVHCYAGVGL